MSGDDRFRWHPAARLVDAAGRGVAPGLPPGVRFIPVIEDRPAEKALITALAGEGRAFRIGGPGPAPSEGPYPAFETLTGGTTGRPRRIRRSQASWTASFARNAALFDLGPGARTAILGGLIHSLALYGALESLQLGAELHLLAGLRPDRQRLALAARRVGHLYATPAQMRQIVEAPGPDLPNLTRILIGGSKLDPALRAALARLAPAARVQEFYGAAEASFVTLADPATPPDSVGRPYPGVRLWVRDALGYDLPEGETGAVWVDSPYLFDGYADAPPRPPGPWALGEEGWLRDGCLFLAGRSARKVKIADQTVYPEAIETFLLAQPGITRAAVLPRPDAKRGLHLIAALQGRFEADGLLPRLRREFGPLAAPRRLIAVSDWPELASGKTDLPALERLV